MLAFLLDPEAPWTPNRVDAMGGVPGAGQEMISRLCSELGNKYLAVSFVRPMKRFATMQAEVQQLQRLVEDLRTLSLADAGELKLHIQSVKPGELLEGAAAAFQHQAEWQKVQIKVKAEPGLPEIRVDPERLEEVLGNLISNALRYTPEDGEISLAAQ